MIHVTALESMAAQLNDLGEPISEHALITTLLCSLPRLKFRFLLSAWDNLKKHERSMEELRTQIVSEQRRLDLDDAEERESKTTVQPSTSNNESGALFGFNNNRRNNSSRSFRGGRGLSNSQSPRDVINRDKAKCTYCGKNRHYEFECRMRIANEGDKQGTSTKKATKEGDSSEPNVSLISSCYLITDDHEALYLDSGASRHMSGDRSLFQNLRDISPNSWPIHGIGGITLYARGVGTIKLLINSNDGEPTEGEIKDVLYVPDLGVNLVSIVCLDSSGFEISFSQSKATIKRNKKVVLTASKSKGTLYKVDAITLPVLAIGLAASMNSATLSTWHERLGHVNRRSVQQMSSGIGVSGMSVSPGGSK